MTAFQISSYRKAERKSVPIFHGNAVPDTPCQNLSSVQPVTRGVKARAFRTTNRQVSWLIDLCALPSSRLPSEHWQALPKYSDEFVQDSHLFPFSPDPMQQNCHLSDTCLFALYHMHREMAMIFEDVFSHYRINKHQDSFSFCIAFNSLFTFSDGSDA